MIAVSLFFMVSIGDCLGPLWGCSKTILYFKFISGMIGLVVFLLGVKLLVIFGD